MNLLIWIILGATGVAIASQLMKREANRKVSEFSDKDFVEAYQQLYSGVEADVIRERKFIGKNLGLDYIKLRPEHKFDDLSRLTGFLTEYQVGMSDLEAELIEACERAGLARPQTFPVTVGEFIFTLLSAKQAKSRG